MDVRHMSKLWPWQQQSARWGETSSGKFERRMLKLAANNHNICRLLKVTTTEKGLLDTPQEKTDMSHLATWSWTSCAEQSWAELNCAAWWKGEIIVTYLQSAVRGSQAVECHSRLCLSARLVLFTGPWTAICGGMLFHHLIPCHLKRRFRTSLLRRWGIFLCKRLQLGSERIYPLRDYVTYQSERWLDHPQSVRALQVRLNRIRTANPGLFLRADRGGSGFSKITRCPAHWSWNSAAIPPGHHASLITWTQGKTQENSTGQREGREENTKQSPRYASSVQVLVLDYHCIYYSVPPTENIKQMI